MTDNRTTELLREGLTERGVRWTSKPTHPETTWSHDGWWYNAKFEPWSDSTFKVTIYDVTPEQAIAATLGNEREKKLESLVRFMEPFFKSAVSHECGCPEGYFEPHGCDNGCMALKELDERMVALGLLEVD